MPADFRPSDVSLTELVRRAQVAFEALTPDERTHHRHLQRISFTVGNVALSRPDVPRDSIERLAIAQAGRCPCGRCSPTLVVADPTMVRADTTCPAATAEGRPPASTVHTFLIGADRCLCGAHAAEVTARSSPDLSCPKCGAPAVMNPPGVTPRLRVEHRVPQDCGAMCSSTQGWPGVTHPDTCGCVGGAAR